jgi:pimeloyl-ACP methyl ester carboxylesterase/DNA-binding CsgD family transcriptional regulator
VVGARDDPAAERGQTIRFARSGARTVAWAAVGAGPPLVVGGWWMGHLELNWVSPAFRAFFGALADRHTVVRYDRPGSGLSPGPPDRSLDGEVAALAEVVSALGDAPVTLLGASSGGPVAAALAARRPDLVERLVLYGTYADGSRIACPAVRDQLVALVAAHWGLGARVLADLFLPGATPAERDEFARFQRASATAATASASLAAAYAFDVRAELDQVAAPTLVLHRRDDRAIPVALGRDVAATVPGAAFVALEGDEHFPWRGDADAVLRAVLAFLPGSSESGRRSPEVAAPASVLSRRELDVLRLVAEGLADREIARRLSLSPHTVHRHLANVRSKLALPSRAAAAAYATRHHLLEP